jgi:putative polyhydroxyalkanoate system protein
MSDITYQHSHTLGMDKARALANDWVEDTARKMGLTCKHEQGADHDTISFERMGVHGTMLVSPTSFDLSIKLGMMMKAFKPMIEAEVSKNLTRIIDKASGSQA